MQHIEKNKNIFFICVSPCVVPRLSWWQHSTRMCLLPEVGQGWYSSSLSSWVTSPPHPSFGVSVVAVGVLVV